MGQFINELICLKKEPSQSMKTVTFKKEVKYGFYSELTEDEEENSESVSGDSDANSCGPYSDPDDQYGGI